jgi:uncharacterized protein (DUF488 family)
MRRERRYQVKKEESHHYVYLPESNTPATKKREQESVFESSKFWERMRRAMHYSPSHTYRGVMLGGHGA